MASIAKNIKRLRGERGLTQEQLAETLCVTRQTVSSWENNRTQPDIDMLTALSAALGADIEELIYGKRRSVGLETPENDTAAAKHLSGVVLAVFGSLLLAAGCIILIVWLWRDVPELARRILSFLPAAAGMGVALWAAFGKKRSQFISEAAAVVWIAGFCASVALVNHTFSVDFGFNRLLLADTLLILPVMFALDSAAAFTALNGFAIVFAVRYGEDGNLPMLALTALFFAVSLLYRKTNRLPAYLKDLTRWVTVIAGVTYATVTVQYAERQLMEPRYSSVWWIVVLFCCCAALFAADRATDNRIPVRYPAALVMTLLSFFYYIHDYELMNARNGNWFTQHPAFAVTVTTACALLLAGGVVYGRKSFRADRWKALFLVCALANLICLFFEPAALHVLLIAALGTLLIVRGVRTLKLLPLNFGMATVTVDIALMIWGVLADNLPLIGGFCAALGVVMLLINKKLLSVKKEKAAKEAATDA